MLLLSCYNDNCYGKEIEGRPCTNDIVQSCGNCGQITSVKTQNMSPFIHTITMHCSGVTTPSCYTYEMSLKMNTTFSSLSVKKETNKLRNIN